MTNVHVPALDPEDPADEFLLTVLDAVDGDRDRNPAQRNVTALIFLIADIRDDLVAITRHADELVARAQVLAVHERTLSE